MVTWLCGELYLLLYIWSDISMKKIQLKIASEDKQSDVMV